MNGHHSWGCFLGTKAGMGEGKGCLSFNLSQQRNGLIKLQMNQFLFLYNISWLEAEVLPEFPFACYNTYKNARYSRMLYSKCCFPGPCSLVKLIGRSLKKEKEKETNVSPHTPDCKYQQASRFRSTDLETISITGMAPRRCVMFGQNKMEEW